MTETTAPAVPAPPTAPHTDQVVLVLSPEEAETLTGTFASAKGGREDFEHLVAQDEGDYEPADIEETRAYHMREVALEDKLALTIRMQTRPVQYELRTPNSSTYYAGYKATEEAEAALVDYKLDPAEWRVTPTHVKTAHPRVFLDLSNSLLTEDEMTSIASAPPRVIEHEYGAWVHVPPAESGSDPLDEHIEAGDERDPDWDDFPNLRLVLIEARKLGAWWVNLDADGYDVLAGLPTYDW